MTTYRTLPDGNILVHVPMRLVRKQSGVRLLATESGANMSRNEEMLNLQALALGLKYRRVALTDECPSRFKMAQHYGFDSSYLTRMIRLGYLSPVIVEKMARLGFHCFAGMLYLEKRAPMRSIVADNHVELSRLELELEHVESGERIGRCRKRKARFDKNDVF